MMIVVVITLVLETHLGEINSNFPSYFICAKLLSSRESTCVCVVSYLGDAFAKASDLFSIEGHIGNAN